MNFIGINELPHTELRQLVDILQKQHLTLEEFEAILYARENKGVCENIFEDDMDDRDFELSILKTPYNDKLIKQGFNDFGFPIYKLSSIGRNRIKYIEDELKFLTHKSLLKCHPACCFCYDNPDYFMVVMQDVTAKLRAYELIPESTTFDSIGSLFRGTGCKKTFTWLGKRSILTHIVKRLCDGDEPLVTTWPKTTSKWDVISSRFIDGEGNPLPNIRKDSLASSYEVLVSEVVSIFRDYKRN